jgi:hypothetical protein
MEKISTSRLDLLPNINELKNNCLSLACLFILFTSESFYLNDNTFIYTYDSTRFFIVYFHKHGAFIYGYDKDSVISTVNYSNDTYAKPWSGLFNNVPSQFHYDIKKLLIHILSFDKPDYDTNIDKIDFSEYKVKIGKIFDENKSLEEFIDNLCEIIDSQSILNYFYPRLTYFIWRTNEDKEWKTNLYNFDENDYLKDGSKELSVLESNIDNISKLVDKYQNISYEKDYTDKDQDYIYLDLKILEHIYSHKPVGNRIIKKIRPNIKVDDLNYLKTRLKSIGYPVI